MGVDLSMRVRSNNFRLSGIQREGDGARRARLRGRRGTKVGRGESILTSAWAIGGVVGLEAGASSVSNLRFWPRPVDEVFTITTAVSAEVRLSDVEEIVGRLVLTLPPRLRTSPGKWPEIEKEGVFAASSAVLVGAEGAGGGGSGLPSASASSSSEGRRGLSWWGERRERGWPQRLRCRLRFDCTLKRRWQFSH